MFISQLKLKIEIEAPVRGFLIAPMSTYLLLQLMSFLKLLFIDYCVHYIVSTNEVGCYVWFF
jgi:hypothetical protein